MFMLIFTSCSVEQLESKNPIVETDVTAVTETPVKAEVDIKPSGLSTSTSAAPTNTLVSQAITPTAVMQICSPVEGVKLENITSMIFNPYYPPAAGSDDPHQGIDLSDVDLDTQIAKTGLGVNSIINGQVVMVMNDRFPYGNAVLVESAFDSLPSGWQNTILNETAPASWGTNPALTCPSGWDQDPESNADPSIFILYAHLENPPEVTQGQLIKCGENIGRIGMSGNALAPHLHIEIRYGPSSGLTDSMAHYDTSASLGEMSNYCRWRVSGWYRLLDPMSLLLQK